MLTERYASQLKNLLVPLENFLPFDSKWSAQRGVSDELESFILERAEKYLHFDWPSLSATLFMDFVRTGNRARYEKPYFIRRNALHALIMGEWIEGKGRFLDDIINGLWAICEETTWILPAHLYMASKKHEPIADVSEPIIDLFASETGAELAWAHYLLEPALAGVSPLLVERIQHELKRRIIDPYLKRNDYWWMLEVNPFGINNWAPWCTSNCLGVILLLEADESKRMKAVSKSMRTLDLFIASYPADGGCDEGSSYWYRAGGSLFDCLELLYTASGGKISIYNERLIGEIGRFMLKTYIADDYFVNYADGSARHLGTPVCLYRYGERIVDAGLASLGRRLHREGRKQGELLQANSLYRELQELACYERLTADEEGEIFLQDTWMPDLQIATARETSGSAEGFYLSAKGGNNAENHNHNDVGQFIVYLDGKPLLIDPGVEIYTAQTFSDQRYEIWCMQSSYHNLPAINGFQQQAGREYAARSCDYEVKQDQASFTVELAGAYPVEAGVERWRRSLILDRTTTPKVTLEENVILREETANIAMHWMTPCLPKVVTNNEVRLFFEEREVARVQISGPSLECKIEPIELVDEKLRHIWGQQLYRIVWMPKGEVKATMWQFSIFRS
ncbi:heparinase II/III domain-containing protein [Paenibacillus sp. IITD108]|uniref:heparinase II/III domain-containing protein n=1 Tax=Paenibacillus sp. IITD108 TaxID=3116649 RepID=UPI002F4284B7